MKKEEAAALFQKQFSYPFTVSEFMGETTLEVQKECLLEVLGFFKHRCGFIVLTDLAGVDYLLPYAHTKMVYFLQNPENYQRIKVKVSVKREEALASIVNLWGGAEWFERELYDLFGVQFTGNLELKRLLMPDDWIGHPLRKDYALTELPVEFKHNVKPKIPSEIIPSFGGING